MMQMVNYPRGEGASCCRIDNDGPARIAVRMDTPRLRSTPRLSRFAAATRSPQIGICVGGMAYGG